jgi:2-oxo-4-hydroxy-4-carboxy--5-ureidoimidazoline (OHCU) decarboxylase
MSTGPQSSVHRELPHRLTLDELARLFEGETALTRRLATLEDPLGVAAGVARELPEEERLEALNSHPAIGAARLSERSAREQGADDDPAVLAELAELNRAYEQKFGFRFVVFVNRRPRSAIVPVLRERLGRSRQEELQTALDELVAIARNRWEHGEAPLAPAASARSSGAARGAGPGGTV